jgi:hypothetical protein
MDQDSNVSEGVDVGGHLKHWFSWCNEHHCQCFLGDASFGLVWSSCAPLDLSRPLWVGSVLIYANMKFGLVYGNFLYGP